MWFTFAPTITGAQLTKTWSVKHQTLSTQSASVTCTYDDNSGDLSGAALCIAADQYISTLAGVVVTTPTAFTPTSTVRLFDLTGATPIEVVPCPTCEPLEFELVPGTPYTAVVGVKHLQPLGVTGITSGYFEGNTGSSPPTGMPPGPIVPTTRLPIAPLTPNGDGLDRYCSAITVLTFTTARCTQSTTVGGVRWAAALGLTAASVTTAASSAAGSTLVFKRSGTDVLFAPPVFSYSWATTEAPTP